MRKGFWLLVIIWLLVSPIAWSRELPSAWVINSLAETLSRIDPLTGTVENDVLTLGLAPNHMVIQGDVAYVVNSLSNDIQIIHLGTRTTLATIDLGPNNNPFHMALVGTQKAYVTNLVSDKVAVLNLDSKEVVRWVPVGRAPEGVVSDGHYAYVANTGFDPNTFTYGQGTLSVINIQTDSVVATIPVPTNPQYLALDPRGFLHVSCTGNYADIPGKMVIVDTYTFRVVDTLDVGGTPGVITLAGEKVYVAAGGWATEGYLFSYNAETHEIYHDASNPLKMRVGVISVSYDNQGHLYVANFSDDTVQMLDVETDTVMATFLVGDGPVWIALWPTPSQVILDSDEENGPPRGFELLQNYPNPVKAPLPTHLAFRLARPGWVSLEVYNLLGQRVQQVFQGFLRAGRYSFPLDTAPLPSGSYFCRLSTPWGREHKAFVVIK